MRFLVDENLSPQLCQLIVTVDDVVQHVTDALGPGTTDQAIMAHAVGHDAVVLTADTDFGTLREVLANGAIVVLSPTDIRVRPLPIV
jgi:predicted nuclease of predicted toxin-antitoxin system